MKQIEASSEALPNGLNTRLSNFIRTMSQLVSIVNFFFIQVVEVTDNSLHKRWLISVPDIARNSMQLTSYFLHRQVEYGIRETKVA